MTTINVRSDLVRGVAEACAVAGLRPPSALSSDGTITWLPDLTAAEQSTLQTIQSLVVGGMLITPAERQAIDSDIQLLVAFQGIATPTLAQTAAAVKSQSRVLRAILRS